MIKDQMLFPLAVDTETVKATTAILYTASDAELKAYTIGFIPWEMVQKSVIFKGMQSGDLSEAGNLNFSYTVYDSFRPDRGLPFCYSYAVSPSTASLNAYYDGSSYINLPWGVNSESGLIHAYNTGKIITDAPGSIQETLGIFARFVMFCVLLPEGSEGGASPSSGSNGWVVNLPDKTTTIDPLTLEFSVTSGTYSSYMPTPVTFTQDDLINSENGIMKKANGTTSYAGITYNIVVHCAITNAYLSQISATNLKEGIIQADRIRYSGLGGTDTPLYAYVVNNSTNQGVFTANSIESISVEYPSSTVYYILQSDTGYEYFKISGTNANNLISGGFTETDLKILRSVARPIYKISNAFYVAEFDDDYQITGELIPYSQAREWQKNINPDTNEFDYEDIPEPEPGEGEDWEGDRILPPVISGIGDLNGFITMYGMTPTQVAALGSYLWAKFTDTAFWESISAVLDNTASVDPSNILNYVVSIRAYPFDLSDVAGTTPELPLVYFGRGLVGIPVGSPTSLSLRVIHKCVDSFAGGDLQVPAYYNDFRDMEPCAKLLLHVPFCGSCEINPSQVVNKHLFLRYTIDFATGGMMAICYTSDSSGEMAYPVAELHGHVGASVQLTGSNEIDALQSIAGVGSGIASLMMGNPSGLLSGVVGAASSLASNRAVPHTTGKASGFSAYFQPRVPYIEIVYDQYYKPSNYAHTHGNACQAVKKIGDLHGYTVCKNVDTSGLTCEGDERIVIKRILESGFYVD